MNRPAAQEAGTSNPFPINVQKRIERTNRITRWIFPTKTNLHTSIRLLLGVVGNVALLIYVLPRSKRLFDIRDYMYVSLDRRWTFGIACIPLVILIVLLPAFRSEQASLRWLAVALFSFPAILVIVEWLQLLFSF